MKFNSTKNTDLNRIKNNLFYNGILSLLSSLILFEKYYH